jgi:hypothetical protein
MTRKLTTRRAVGLAAASIAAAPVLAFSAVHAAAPDTNQPPAPGWPAPSVSTPAPAPSVTTGPRPETCTTIAYDAARLVPQGWRWGMPRTPRYQVVVSGRSPYANQTVKLVPHVYVQQPEYWGIEVQGCTGGRMGLPALRPYTVRVDVAATMGSKGVEVIGANRHQRFDVPPGRQWTESGS